MPSGSRKNIESITLMPLNIQARYPEDKDLLLKSLNHKKCSDILNQTEVLYKWIKELIKK